MAGLVYPPCRACLYLVDGRAPGTVYSRQPEYLDRNIVFLTPGKPVAFCIDTALAAFAARTQIGCFVDPAAVAVAVDPCGREIADPFNSPGGGDVFRVMSERRITIRLRWDGQKNMIKNLELL